LLAQVGGIQPLIALLEGHPEIHHDVAGALWSLAANRNNQTTIANMGGQPRKERSNHRAFVAAAAFAASASLAASDAASAHSALCLICAGIAPLVDLLKNGSREAQETTAGALHALAETADNRVSIATAGGVCSRGSKEDTPRQLACCKRLKDASCDACVRPQIPLLVALFDGGTEVAVTEAAGALQTMAQQNVPNQHAIANEAVAMLKKSESAEAQEHVTSMLKTLAQDPENRSAIAKAGAVPELVRQLECGSERAMGMAASGLALIALKSAEHRAVRAHTSPHIEYHASIRHEE
jgi:hypothetical protein